MKFIWMGALALCGAVAITPSFIEAGGGVKEVAGEDAPDTKDDVPTFDSAAEVVAHLNAEAKKLGRGPSQEKIKAYFDSSLAIAKKHILGNDKADDLEEVYNWVIGYERYVGKEPAFFEIAELYLKAHPKLTDGNAYTWKKTLVLGQLKGDGTKKAAEAEIKKLEADGAKDAASAVIAADIRIAVAAEKKENKSIADITAALKKNKLVMDSKEPWVQRDTQRILLGNSAAVVKDGEAFPCWSEVMAVRDLDGKEIKIADYKGKVVLIDFWATWCGPCVKDMPEIIEAYKELNAKGFEVIGLSFDGRDGEQKLRDMIGGKGKLDEMPWRQVYDGGGWSSGMAGRYGVRSIPHTILIGKDGKVVAQKLRGKALISKIHELVGGGEEESN